MIFSFYFVEQSENIRFSLVVSYELETNVHDRNVHQITKEARKRLNKKTEKQNKTTECFNYSYQGEALIVSTAS